MFAPGAELESFGENIAHDPVGHAQHEGHEEGGYDAGAHCSEGKRLGMDEGIKEEGEDGRLGGSWALYMCEDVAHTDAEGVVRRREGGIGRLK